MIHDPPSRRCVLFLFLPRCSSDLSSEYAPPCVSLAIPLTSSILASCTSHAIRPFTRLPTTRFRIRPNTDPVHRRRLRRVSYRRRNESRIRRAREKRYYLARRRIEPHCYALSVHGANSGSSQLGRHSSRRACA
ncbi:hypothetical protein B0H11DRAFT_2113474 [Mycena galericulata]|nr:hypothetical protein B0H11DRAFT_2113474 [Mycena galericulata]